MKYKPITSLYKNKSVEDELIYITGGMVYSKGCQLFFEAAVDPAIA